MRGLCIHLHAADTHLLHLDSIILIYSRMSRSSTNTVKPSVTVRLFEEWTWHYANLPLQTLEVGSSSPFYPSMLQSANGGHCTPP
jgi:hypothetical protein